jgi:tellurite resistance protein
MIKRERLYDAFGELIYAITVADGAIQREELLTLEAIIGQHPWSEEIKWSFNYESQKHHSVEESYQKAIEACKENGPDPEYKYFVAVMTQIAESFGGIVPQERKIIDDFRNDLRQRFINDLEHHRLGNLRDVD